MNRTYNVFRVIEDQKMVNYGQVIKLNNEPMTHAEACKFMLAHTKHKWCRHFLKEA